MEKLIMYCIKDNKILEEDFNLVADEWNKKMTGHFGDLKKPLEVIRDGEGFTIFNPNLAESQKNPYKTYSSYEAAMRERNIEIFYKSKIQYSGYFLNPGKLIEILRSYEVSWTFYYSERKFYQDFPEYLPEDFGEDTPEMVENYEDFIEKHKKYEIPKQERKGNKARRKNAREEKKLAKVI